MEYLCQRLGVAALTFAIALSASIAARADFYVATNGNNAWSGLLPAPNGNGTDGPFATLEAARNAIRSLKSGSGLPVGGVRVNLRGGRYTRQSPFTLTTYQQGSDSGTPTSPIVYQAYPGETPLIIGGINVTGFQAVTAPAILARFSPSAQTNVLVANLAAQGITNIIPLARHGFGLWGSWAGQDELFFQDQPMQLARWPNSNWLTTASSPSPGTNYFGYSGSNPSTWASLSDIWVEGYWYCDWAEEYEHVSSIDTTNHIVYITSPASQYGYAVNQRFYFLNILEELDSPGEYYIDRVHGLLYFWPPGGIVSGHPFITTVGAGAGVKGGGLVNLQSVSNIVFSGITFEGAVGPLLFISGGQSNLVNSCVLIGGSCDGIDISGSTGNSVSYCTISQIGEKGIYIWNSGDRITLIPGTNLITCNTIHDPSRLCRTSNPGIRISGVGDSITHNLIYNVPNIGLQFGGNDNIIEYNEIHHTCTESSEAGAIYAYGDWTARGNIIRYNYIHDANGITGVNRDHTDGTTGIFLDEMISGTAMYGNILCATDVGVKIGGGRDNTVQNNIFVGCTNEAIWADQRGLNYEAGTIANTNSMLWTELYAMPYQIPPWSSEYPALVSIATNKPGAALGNVILNNISYGNAAWISFHYGAQTNVTVANNFTSGDPLFVNYSQRQFGLATNSPAWALGFQPIPVNGFGPGLSGATGLRVTWPP